MSALIYMSDLDMNSRKVINLGAGSASTDAVNKQQLDDGVTSAKSRATHTGTQLAATIADFDTQVRTSTLAQMAAPAGSVSLNSQKIINLLDPTSAQDAASKAYVDTSIAALSGGLVFKGKVRAATASNISTTSAPATIDGVTPSANDVFLLTGQTTGAQNGPWVWASAGAAMTRPTNFDTAGEAVPGSLWVVQQGTYDNQLAILSNDTFTLNTTTGTFVFLNPASAADNDSSYTETSPATAAGAAWPINHGLGSRNVHVTIYRTASPYDEVQVSVTHDTTAQVNVRADVALGLGEYTAYVTRVV